MTHLLFNHYLIANLNYSHHNSSEYPHTSMLSLIAKEVKARQWQYVYLDGSTKDREKIVTQLQEDPKIQLFLISLKAGGIGLNLTAADYVFIYDPWWNEAAENQAIDRAHRIGKQTPKAGKIKICCKSREAPQR